MSDTNHRRLFGVIFGTLLGLGYGIVSQSINHIILPGVPLYQPPFGPLGNVVVTTLVGALVGTICAWLPNDIGGVFAGAVTGALLLAVATLLTGRTDAEILPAKSLAVFFLLVPIIATLLPLMAIFRWVANREEVAHIHHLSAWFHIRAPLVIVIVFSAAGAFSLASQDARIMLPKTHNLIQEGLKVSQAADLPAPLQGNLVGDFQKNALGAYNLQWDNKEVNRFSIPRLMSQRPWEEAVVIARFESGWILVCLYPQTDRDPTCKGYGGQ